MAKEKFEDRPVTGNFRVTCKYDDGSVRIWEGDKAEVVRRIIRTVREYAADGYKLTLRQLHYQFVQNNWIVNHTTAYKKLGTILDDCRYSGLIDWDAIEDRGRVPFIPYSAEDLPDGLTDLKNQYRINRQEGQTNYVELWTEKDALSGILKRSTSKYHIQLVVNKGYTSSSAAYEAYSRISEKILAGLKVTILYFGDHDPSGLDMVRDIEERLLNFLSRGDQLNNDETFLDWRSEWFDRDTTEITLRRLMEEGGLDLKWAKKFGTIQEGEEVERTASQKVAAYEAAIATTRVFLKDSGLFRVLHIGLTMEQIEEYSLPPNPAKISDPRADAYIAQFGEISWEVDALKPQILTEIVEAHVEELLDMDTYEEVMAREDADRDQIQAFIDSLPE